MMLLLSLLKCQQASQQQATKSQQQRLEITTKSRIIKSTIRHVEAHVEGNEDENDEEEEPEAQVDNENKTMPLHLRISFV